MNLHQEYTHYCATLGCDAEIFKWHRICIGCEISLKYPKDAIDIVIPPKGIMLP